jgi:ribosomal protein S15P/S13E
MHTNEINNALTTLFGELVDGAPRDPSYMLNTGDIGLLGSLGRLSAADASQTHAGGASIAAHVDHLRYGLSLMNAWRSGVDNPWLGADWTASWRITSVSDREWQQMRAALRDETHRWQSAMGAARELNETQLTYMIANIAHLAYHVGAIRQIDRSTRGPLATESAASSSKPEA